MFVKVSLQLFHYWLPQVWWSKTSISIIINTYDGIYFYVLHFILKSISSELYIFWWARVKVLLNLTTYKMCLFRSNLIFASFFFSSDKAKENDGMDINSMDSDVKPPKDSAVWKERVDYFHQRLCHATFLFIAMCTSSKEFLPQFLCIETNSYCILLLLFLLFLFTLMGRKCILTVKMVSLMLEFSQLLRLWS